MNVGTNENERNINEINPDFDVIKNAETFENTGNANDKVIDFDATQRIDFLGELIKNTERAIANSSKEQHIEQKIEQQEEKQLEQQIGQSQIRNVEEIQQNDVNQNENITNEINNEIIDIQNSSSEISAEPIAQQENLSNISNENVQKNPAEINIETNVVNIEMENNGKIAESTENINNVYLKNENIDNNQKNVQQSNINFIICDSDIEVSEKRNNIINEKQTLENENISGEEVVLKNDEEILKDKEKQHAQDKKDYRLERMLFERINKMQGKIKESLELIKKFERINAKEENLPNIVTTLHDKLTQEVIKQFRTVGIEFNMKSYLVQSVVSDLLARFGEGITEFKECSENLNFVREVQDDFESRVELAPTSKVKNLFARLRGMFKPERKQEKLEELERERQEKKLEEANIHLIKYKFINSELEKYTIKKNIVGSLKKEIINGQGSGLTMNLKDFISERITPEMKKLGLDDCVQELEQSIFEEYKSRNNEISKEVFEQLPISEIRRGIKVQRIDIMRSKMHNVVDNNSHEDEEEKLAI